MASWWFRTNANGVTMLEDDLWIGNMIATWFRPRHESHVIVKTCPGHVSDKPLSTLSQRPVALTTTLCNDFAPMVSPWSHQSLFLDSQWQQGREHINCSVQILLQAAQVLSAGPFSVQHLALHCYQNAKPVNNRYTKNMCHSGFQACQRDTSGSICAGVSCENQQKDQAALVTPGRIVPGHDKEILLQKANAAYGCIWNVLLYKHAIPQVCDGRRVSHGNYSKQHVTNGAFQLPAAWNYWVLSRSDTSLTLGEFRHKDTCLVLVWWGAELAKLCKMLRSVSIERFKTVVAIYAVEGPVLSV